MAINQWANVTLNPAAATIPDRSAHHNVTTRGTSAANNLCVSWDSAVITDMTKWDSAVASARKLAQQQM